MDNDDGGALFMLGAWVVVAAIVIYLVYQAIKIIAVSGVVWGGGTALYNYGASFKENMIDRADRTNVA